MTRPAKLLVADLDNTVYDWTSFYAPSFRAMVHAISGHANLPEGEIVGQFREVFRLHESVEYPFAVQKLRLCRYLSRDEVDRLVHIGQVAFGRTRRRRLKPYDGVRETLDWAASNGIQVVAATNAPWYQAWSRLRRLAMATLFTGIVGWEGFPVEADDPYAPQLKGDPRARPGLCIPISKSSLKPNPKMYQTVAAATNVEMDEMWVVGDSLEKDVLPAISIGAHGVWAEYGDRDVSDVDRATILNITHWSSERISTVYNRSAGRGQLRIEQFSDLRKLLPTRQGSLWAP